MSDASRDPSLHRFIQDCSSGRFDETDVGYFVFINGVQVIDRMVQGVGLQVSQLIEKRGLERLIARKNGKISLGIMLSLYEDYNEELSKGRCHLTQEQLEDYKIAQEELEVYLSNTFKRRIEEILKKETRIKRWNIVREGKGYYIALYT